MKVSVCMLTYNQAAYIQQALDSVLMQKINFDLEIIIGDDFSKDGTRDIIRDYAARYPHIIKPILRSRNIGVIPNLIEVLHSCSGEYVAMLDGDDFWTEDEKLQKQINYLEHNPGVVISAHNSKFLLPDGTTYLFNNLERYQQFEEGGVFTIEDYIIRSFFHTSSIVFRSSCLPVFPEWFNHVFAGDFFLVLQLGLKGKFHYCKFSQSVYRINSTSVSNFYSRVEIVENARLHLLDFNRLSEFKFERAIKEKRFYLQFGLMYYHPNYFRKLGFAAKNVSKIFKMRPEINSRIGRWKILLPTSILTSRLDIFEKKQAS